MLKYSVQICPGGEVVNASVCKTDMRGFESHPGLTNFRQPGCLKFVSVTPQLTEDVYAQVVESVGELVQGTGEQGLS